MQKNVASAIQGRQRKIAGFSCRGKITYPQQEEKLQKGPEGKGKYELRGEEVSHTTRGRRFARAEMKHISLEHFLNEMGLHGKERAERRKKE